MQMQRWARGWQRIWCSTPRRRFAISAGIAWISSAICIKKDGLRDGFRICVAAAMILREVKSGTIPIVVSTRNHHSARDQKRRGFYSGATRSYRTQTYHNWELVVSDDGSTDDTIKIIEEFAQQVPQRVVVRRGPQIGFWQNFVSLVRSDDIDGDLYAYSDQDDVWFPEKLAKAVSWFEARPSDQPALYFTRTELSKRVARRSASHRCSCGRRASKCAGAKHRRWQHHGV